MTFWTVGAAMSGRVIDAFMVETARCNRGRFGSVVPNEEVEVEEDNEPERDLEVDALVFPFRTISLVDRDAVRLE